MYSCQHASLGSSNKEALDLGETKDILAKAVAAIGNGNV
jgi:hypothetical protein